MLMEGLYHLSPELSWTPTALPSGRFIGITDRLVSSGSFLVHHFIALYLKAGAFWHAVAIGPLSPSFMVAGEIAGGAAIVITASHSKDHYTTIGKKLVTLFAGCNLCARFGPNSGRVRRASPQAFYNLQHLQY